jgi:hypothetical protein
MSRSRSRAPAEALVADAFRELLMGITPTAHEVESARSRVDAIKKRLASSFYLRNVQWVGSYSKGTAVRGLSDVDLFACLARDEVRWGGRVVNSKSFAKRVRDELQGRYPATEVRRDGPAVALRFATGTECFDVVPAVFADFQGGSPTYHIPDGSGGWVLTAPYAQQRYVHAAATRSGGKLPRVVQVIKWWTQVRKRAIPLRSFHIEMALAGADAAVGAYGYAKLTAAVFRMLADRQGAALRDPLQISGLIQATPDAKRDSLTKALRQSAGWARAAVDAAAEGDADGALAGWNRVFNGMFP